jgi:hypothetical protein
MADKKISALTAATTPLAGTEVLPIVQGGATVKVAVSDLTAGRNVAMADLTTTGNTILGNAQADTLNVGNGDIIKDSSGNVGVGAAPSQKFDVRGNCIAAGNGPGAYRTYYGSAVTFANALGGASATDVCVRSDGELVLATSGPYERVRITTAGDVTIKAGNLVIGTSGKGIDFSANGQAAGMTSELLDDYEEGTWTPTIAGQTTAGVNTYTTQVGRYTKIGDTVYVQISIVVNAMGTGGDAGAGYTTIAGLPFTLGGSSQIAFSIGWLALVTFSNIPNVYGQGGNTFLTLRNTLSADYGGTIDISSVADGAFITVAGSYKI